MVKDIKSIIEEKGNELTNCRDNCEGIISDDEHLPRCLFYEDEEGDKSKLGCIIVGLNPGEANEDEIKGYKENPTYKTVREYWEKQNYYYYQDLRTFANKLGFTGPILWTEVIKCEKAKGTIPPKTFIHCFNKYCREEIKEAPEDWPIVAVGNEAFKLLGCAYPNRKVIGVWHPAYNKGRNFYKTRLPLLELKDRIVEIEDKPCWLEDLID